MGRVSEEVDAERDAQIIQILSMNGRATLDFIGSQVGLSKHPAYRRVKALEERYGIRYLPEIDTTKFGFFSYVAFVKFKESMPDANELRDDLLKDPRIQLAVLTSGEYDMMIYFLSDSHRDVAYFIFELSSYGTLSFYPAEWYVSQYYQSKFIPLRDEFFDVLKKKVWRRTRENKRPAAGQMLEREYNVLRELNRDASIDFIEMDSKYGYGKGASRYTFYKLKEREILTRITITLTKLPIKYHAIMFASFFQGAKFAKSRPNLLLELMKHEGLTDKYVLTGDIGIPSGTMVVMPIFTENQLRDTEEYFTTKVTGMKFKKLIVTDILLGSFIYRRFDSVYTNQYRLLVEDYKVLKPEKRIEYDAEAQTTRRRKNEGIYHMDLEIP
jgi:DNA-binding Lrp family transcriptional regulator